MGGVGEARVPTRSGAHNAPVPWSTVMVERFANDPIEVAGLPQLDDEAFVSVDPRYAWGSLAGVAAGIAVVVVVAGLWVSSTDAIVVPIVLAAAGCVGLIAAGVLIWLEAQRLAYLLREHDLSLRSGVVTRAVETIPFSRVQHVSVGRGPIERTLGLATLTVSSAGPDISVSGLTPDDADRIKQLIAEQAGVDDEEGPTGVTGVPLPPPQAVPGSPPPPTPPTPS